MQPQQWAQEQFGTLELGDTRRTQRVVELAAAVFRHPDASLPHQLGDPAALKATYRLLNTPTLTHAALLAAHWQATRQAASDAGTTLLVQDASELDFTAHPQVSGLGPIGNGGGRGLLLQSMLAIRPTSRTVLGLAFQRPTIRQMAPVGESCVQRRKRERESQVWLAGIEQIGTPPAQAHWVHVGDRYADMWPFFTTCQATGTDFLVRVAQDRRVLTTDGLLTHLFAACPHLPVQGSGSVEVAAQGGRAARCATVEIAAGPVQVLPPRQPAGQAPLGLWLIWVHDPSEEADALEWVLLSSVPTHTAADAWERVAWYRCRWIIADLLEDRLWHRATAVGESCGHRAVLSGVCGASHRLITFTRYGALPSSPACRSGAPR